MLNENYDPSKANFDGNNYRITVTVILISINHLNIHNNLCFIL